MDFEGNVRISASIPPMYSGGLFLLSYIPCEVMAEEVRPDDERYLAASITAFLRADLIFEYYRAVLLLHIIEESVSVTQ